MKLVIQYLFALLTLVGLLSSCRDDKVIYAGSVSVTTSSRPLHADCLDNQFVAYVKCSGRGWRATCASDWVELSETQGDDGDYVYLSVAENALDDKRYAVVRFYDIDDPNTLSDYIEIVQEASTHSVNALLTKYMERKHRLGYGYDIFGSFTSDSSFSTKPILDYSFMLVQEQKFGRQLITENLRHNEELEIISANTLTELRSKLTKVEDSSGSFLGCGKSTTTETEIFKNKTVDQECGMIRLKQIVTSRTIDWGAVNYLLNQQKCNNLYSEDFRNAIQKVKKNLNNKEARNNELRSMYKKFGSHLVLSADLGGEIRINTVVERETSVESSHSVKTVSKKIFGKKVSGSTSVYDKYSDSEQIRFKVEMTMTGGSSKAQETIKKKVSDFNINNPITDDEIIQWQNSIQFPTSSTETVEDYNASMVNCRLIPLYDIINDAEVAAAYKEYLVSINADQKASSDDQVPAICPLTNLHPATPESAEEDLYAKCIRVNDNLRAVISSEYIPTIRSDKPCLVAYPIVAGHPFMYSGVFVGDAEHLPGMVRWLGNNCLYEPDEAFASDTLGYKELLDENGQLKNLYLYWGAVQMAPNDQVQCQAKGVVSVAHMELSGDICTQSNPSVVKVGPHYWTRNNMTLKNGGKKMSAYSYQGINYISTGNDPDEWRKANYAWTSYLPSSTQAKSVMAFLNGRSDLMEDTYFTRTGANMLGLNWAKGYIAVTGKTSYPCDMNSWLIPTFEGQYLCITRLGLSGTAVTMNYGDYLQSVGYLDSQFEKFVPFYFCTDEVY